MGSLQSIKADEEIKSYYHKKIGEGKHKMSVLNAVKNKMIHRIFACVTQNRPYEINYQHALVLS